MILEEAERDLLVIARTVSVVLMLAVIACPIVCGSGICCATGKSAMAMESRQLPCLESDMSQCGCEGKPSDRSAPGPQQCPGKSSCQCVCGGAVMERSCAQDTSEALVFLPLESCGSLVQYFAPHHGTVDDQQHRHRGAANLGRFVRTLHSSLLC